MKFKDQKVSNIKHKLCCFMQEMKNLQNISFQLLTWSSCHGNRRHTSTLFCPPVQKLPISKKQLLWEVFEKLSNLFIKILILFSHIFGYVHTVFLFIALGHSCINPFIYFWTDARVRFGFLDLIGSIPGVKRCCRGVQWDNNFGRWEQFFVSVPIWKIWQGRLRRLKKYLKTRESNGV